MLHSLKFSWSKLLISNSQGSTTNWICKLFWEVLFVIGYFICIYNTLSPYCLLIFFTIKWNRKTCPHKHYSVMCSLTFPSHFFYYILLHLSEQFLTRCKVACKITKQFIRVEKNGFWSYVILFKVGCIYMLQLTSTGKRKKTKNIAKQVAVKLLSG